MNSVPFVETHHIRLSKKTSDSETFLSKVVSPFHLAQQTVPTTTTFPPTLVEDVERPCIPWMCCMPLISFLACVTISSPHPHPQRSHSGVCYSRMLVILLPQISLSLRHMEGGWWKGANRLFSSPAILEHQPFITDIPLFASFPPSSCLLVSSSLVLPPSCKPLLSLLPSCS